jgi:hypothetical protein
MKPRNFAEPFRFTDGKKLRLKEFDPCVPPGVSSKDRAAEVLPGGLSRLTELRDKLYAGDRCALAGDLSGNECGAQGQEQGRARILTSVTSLEMELRFGSCSSISRETSKGSASWRPMPKSGNAWTTYMSAYEGHDTQHRVTRSPVVGRSREAVHCIVDEDVDSNEAPNRGVHSIADLLWAS